MNNEDQILDILSSIQTGIADLKERQISIQADITSLKNVIIEAAGSNKGPEKFKSKALERPLAKSNNSADAPETINGYWADALLLLKNIFSDEVFNNWIRPLTPISYQDDTFIIKCDRDIMKITIYEEYLTKIQICLKAIIGRRYVNMCVVSPEDFGPNNELLGSPKDFERNYYKKRFNEIMKDLRDNQKTIETSPPDVPDSSAIADCANMGREERETSGLPEHAKDNNQSRDKQEIDGKYPDLLCDLVSYCQYL